MEILTIILLSVSILFSFLALVFCAVIHSKSAMTFKCVRLIADGNKEVVKYLKAKESNEINNVKETLTIKMIKHQKAVNQVITEHHEETKSHLKLIYKILKGAGDGTLQPEEIVKMIDATGILKEDELDRILSEKLEEEAGKEIQYVGE